ncbi:hypothetical protein K470DRAFT_281314 [Piedraia hortae CBS 480.64]|uniref:DNA polymerase delta subunit 3 n=1 Tax=Piedraia hortae CBS 480.64 TaxID=1314780 RepID=A0A6A7C2J9_9PEZI|nr:hypothetical protein K470DRAFT_281314 [Piedraia hortae CBS 480.64]
MATEYLAANVLNEQQQVNYRMLSRALKVHVNRAKTNLEDFYRSQNAKHAGSVHATYLITGTKQPALSQPSQPSQPSQDGDDAFMQSSPISTQGTPEERHPVPLHSVVLAKQEDLEKAKSSFDKIESVHIYSLEANGLSDIQSLANCNRDMETRYAAEDPLLVWRQYGTIHNTEVKRRTLARKPPAPEAARAPVKAEKAEKSPAKVEKPPAKEAESKTKPPPLVKQASRDSQGPSKSSSKPAEKSKQNSALFKSFAKTKAPKAKEPTPEDEPMNTFSDEEAGPESMDVDDPAPEPAGKSKKDRKAELEAMMEMEDEEMEDVGDDEGAIDKAESAMEGDKDKAEPAKAEPAKEEKETMTVENGRRRGRRRVTKKKTVKDEDGYLGTFVAVSQEGLADTKQSLRKKRFGAKAAPKKPAAGQGNIRSFFQKK